MARSEPDPSPSSSSPAIEPWGTWLDLVLACAVSRHGTDDWAAVALELRSRCTSALPLDPGSCRDRFDSIRRRFDFAGADGCAEQLRWLRVAELRREVERYDLRIESLQLKVKRLEEERERSIHDNTGDHAADAPASSDPLHKPSPEELGAGGESCRESNSTDVKAAAGEGRGDAHRAAAVSSPAQEFDESVAAGSDMQSSAAVAADVEDGSSASAAVMSRGESQPLIKLLDTIRSTKFGSVFERRLASQEGEEYACMIRRHVDLETVQTRLAQCGGGASASYSGAAEFFRDLLIICTNALVFFPKGSAESTAATQLRNLVSKEEAQSRYRTVPLEDSTPLHELLPPSAKPVKDPSAAPIVVCRKRSSVGATSAAVKTDDEEMDDKESVDDPEDMSAGTEATTSKERTGTRGLRTASKSRAPDSSDVETSKKGAGRRSGGAGIRNAAVNLAKKRKAADFLNRLKQGAPSTERVSLLETLKRSADEVGSGGGGKPSDPKSGSRKKNGGEPTRPKRNAGQGSRRGAAATAPAAAKRLKGETRGRKRMRRSS